MGKTLETEKLVLREFEQSDVEFVLTLLNSPNWLKFIGDKNIKSITEALNYIENNKT
ncbi:hypothetical protein [uncultured Lacinutrix sp.]|uniref:GNAT family N-acetyltransferase n=1 Tax=uncultured Lacinutrix sp. TaxID=574032 RepID=UPI00262235BE|nr:hypothetical protein [uncultured Lacinutrix sp.]